MLTVYGERLRKFASASGVDGGIDAAKARLRRPYRQSMAQI